METSLEGENIVGFDSKQKNLFDDKAVVRICGVMIVFLKPNFFFGSH